MREPVRGRRVLLGRIAGAHGIRGEVAILPYTTKPQDIAAYGSLSDASGVRSFRITSARITPKGVVARLEGIEDRTAAAALKGVELYVDRNRLPATQEGEFYHADLIGLTAVDAGGRTIGKIVAVQNFGAGDLIEVALAGSHHTELVPFSEARVPQVDLAAGRAVVVLAAAIEGEE